MFLSNLIKNSKKVAKKMLNKNLKGAIFNRQKNKIKCKKKPVKIYIWEAYSPFEQEWGRSRWRVISGGIFLHVYLWQLNLVLQKTLEYCVLEQKREFKQPLLVTPCLHHGEKQPPQSSKNDVKFKKKNKTILRELSSLRKCRFHFLDAGIIFEFFQVWCTYIAHIITIEQT